MTRIVILLLSLASAFPRATTSFSVASVGSFNIGIAKQGMVNQLTQIINDSYRVGETGIIVDTPENPFERATPEEVADLVTNNKLLALSTADGSAIGCAKIERITDTVGEWGCFAVHKDYQGKGCGNLLVHEIERYMKHDLEYKTAQLELLAPSNWKHQHKERLRSWYVRMGYTLRVPNDYKASTENLSQGSILGGRFVLATDADFTAYQKRLSD
mmetsp:Transcript_33810/g.48059  ORF Transcript_33810/g.48059 Transcript_33810/m.48059 type:complete len:215 (+) Transcript_33810:107-751(+)